MKNNTSKTPPQNPNNPLKKKLAARFLMAMKKLTKTPPSPLTAEKGRRSHAIRAAAYASMASAVGPRKAWSRALLKKLRNHHKIIVRGRKRRRNPRNDDTRFVYEGLSDLSEVVPGGEEMDSCKLLNETGHYIKCLTAQVQIMREILDNYSSRL